MMMMMMMMMMMLMMLLAAVVVVSFDERYLPPTCFTKLVCRDSGSHHFISLSEARLSGKNCCSVGPFPWTIELFVSSWF